MTSTASVGHSLGSVGVIAMHPLHHRLRVPLAPIGHLSRIFALSNLIQGQQALSGSRMLGLQGHLS
jgi:hypothetical protein